MKKVEEMLAEKFAEQTRKIVEDACEGITCDSGGIKMQQMWKMKKKLKGTYSEQPSAISDEHGNFVTVKKGIENVVIKNYEEG